MQKRKHKEKANKEIFAKFKGKIIYTMHYASCFTVHSSAIFHSFWNLFVLLSYIALPHVTCIMQLSAYLCDYFKTSYTCKVLNT